MLTRRVGAVLLGMVLAAASMSTALAHGGASVVRQTDLGKVRGIDQSRSTHDVSFVTSEVIQQKALAAPATMRTSSRGSMPPE